MLLIYLSNIRNWAFIKTFQVILITVSFKINKVELFANLHGIGTRNQHRVIACMAEEIILKDKGSIHNNKGCI